MVALTFIRTSNRRKADCSHTHRKSVLQTWLVVVWPRNEPLDEARTQQHRLSTHSPAAESPSWTASKNEVTPIRVGVMGKIGTVEVSFTAFASTIRLVRKGKHRGLLLALLLPFQKLALISKTSMGGGGLAQPKQGTRDNRGNKTSQNKEAPLPTGGFRAFSTCGRVAR